MIFGSSPASPISFGQVSLTRVRRREIDILITTGVGEGGTYKVELVSGGAEFAAEDVDGSGTNISDEIVFPDATEVLIPARIAYFAPAFPDTPSATLTVNVRNLANAIVDSGSLNLNGQSVVPALVMVLDRSQSMATPLSGDTRANRLRMAASSCLNLMLDHERLGIVTFTDEPTNVLPVKPLDTPNVMLGGVMYANQRAAAEALFSLAPEHPALDPRGGSSIGAGISTALAILAGEVDQNILVFTDGKNAGALAPIASEDIYAVGIGEVADVSTPTLSALTGGTENYLIVNGSTTGSWNVRLAKYLIDVLTDVKNYQILVDSQEALPDVVDSGTASSVAEESANAELRRLLEEALLTLNEIRDELGHLRERGDNRRSKTSAA